MFALTACSSSLLALFRFLVFPPRPLPRGRPPLPLGLPGPLLPVGVSTGVECVTSAVSLCPGGAAPPLGPLAEPRAPGEGFGACAFEVFAMLFMTCCRAASHSGVPALTFCVAPSRFNNSCVDAEKVGPNSVWPEVGAGGGNWAGGIGTAACGFCAKTVMFGVS